MKTAEYNRECGLSKQEWELDNLADEIIASNSSIERIGILRKYMESYAKEHAIEFIKYCDKQDGITWIDADEYPEWYTEWTNQ